MFGSLLGGLFGGGGGGGGGGMSSGGIGNSSSTNQNTQNTTYSDGRMVLGEGSAYVSDSNKNNTSTVWASNSGNTWNTVIDADAVGLAFKGINDTVKTAFGFGSDALDGMLASQKLAQQQVQESIDFAANTQAASMKFATETQNKSFAQSASSLGAATQAMGEALQFGNTQTSRAMDSLMNTAELVKDSYADAKGRGAMTDYLLAAAILGTVFVAWRASKRAGT